MKRRQWFIWLILLGLITSCASIQDIMPSATEEQPTPADTDNDGLAPPPVPQKTSQPDEAMTSSAIQEQPTLAAPDNKPYVQDYSPQCPSLATLSGVHPDNPPVTAESVELTPRSAAQRKQLQLAAISDNQAVQYLQQRQYRQALPLAKTAYRFQNEVLGETHPDSLASLINLALIYQQLGRFSEALPLFEKGHRLYQAVLGEKHPITVMLRDNRVRVEQQSSLAQTDKPPVKPAFQPVKATRLLAVPLPKLVKTAYQEKPLLMASARRVSTSLSDTQQLELAETYNNQAVQYLQQGLFRQALPLAEKAFQIRTELLGEKHPNTLVSLINLALINQQLGRLSEALPLFEKGYLQYQAVLGEKHSITVMLRNNWRRIEQQSVSLAQTDKLSVMATFRPVKATTLLAAPLPKLAKTSYQEKPLMLASAQTVSNSLSAAQIKQQLKLAKTYHNQAFQYLQQGLFRQALPLAEKAFQIRAEVLGEKHPKTFISLNNLAMTYQGLGRLSEALPLLEKGYRISKKVLGEKHPNTFHSMNNLAGIYHDLSHLSEALPLFEKVYRLRKENLGERHPDTLKSLNNLASIYRDKGRLSEALTLFEKGYRLVTKELGEKYLLITITSINNLAMTYQGLGRLSEALPLLEKGSRLVTKELGEKHPLTISSVNNLVIIYRDLGRLSEALPLSEKVYRLSKEVLGEQHPYSLISLNNLAIIYQDLGSLSEGLPLLEKGYRLYKKVLGEKHPDTLTSLNNLAIIYQDLGSLSEALPLLENGYRLYKEVLGEKHPDTLTSLNNLASVYAKQGKINKAIKHFEKLVAGVEQLRSGDFSAENRQALFKRWVPSYFLLSYLYTSQSRYQDAFRLAEMSKARTLLESLAAKLAGQQSGLTTTEQQQLQDDEARLAFLNNRIAKALADNRVELRITLETEKNQLVHKRNQFHQQLMAKYPKYAKLSKVQIVA